MKNQNEVKKRQRSENWLEDDRQLLMQLVNERVSDIENKNTDTKTNVKKKAAWQDLLNSFNIMCTGINRTVPQLKSQWGILKMNRKKQMSLMQRDPENSDDNCSLVPSEFIIENGELDPDQVNQIKIEELPIDDSIAIEILEDEIKQEIASNITDEELDEQKEEEVEIQILPPTPPRCKKRKVLRRERNESKSTSYAANIANFEIKCRKELHRIQMENEKRKARNLDLEETILRAKIAYYKRQNDMY